MLVLDEPHISLNPPFKPYFFSLLIGPSGKSEEVHITHSSKTVLKFEPSGTRSHVAFLNLSVQRGDGGVPSRCHCIEICNDCSPIIQDCNITSKSSCKYFVWFFYIFLFTALLFRYPYSKLFYCYLFTVIFTYAMHCISCSYIMISKCWNNSAITFFAC